MSIPRQAGSPASISAFNADGSLIGVSLPILDSEPFDVVLPALDDELATDDPAAPFVTRSAQWLANAGVGAGGVSLTDKLDVTPEDYGAVGDGVTDDSAAFVAAIAALRANSQSYSDASYKGSGKLRLGAKKYYLAGTTLDINHTLPIEGCGTGQDGGTPTDLIWAAGVTGMRIHRYNTVGATGSDAGSQKAADGTILRGFRMRGGYTNFASEGEYHGIQLRARATIEDVYIYGFQGDGIYINAQSGGVSNEGNANLFVLNRVTVSQCRNGVYVTGADANAGAGFMVNAIGNRMWGIADRSFLGNNWFACHTADNGLINGATPTVVSDGTRRYTVKDGQAAGASANAPSGTTADNTWWLYNGSGDVSPSNNIANWGNGTIYRSGGSIVFDNANARGVIDGCYSEGGQGLVQTWSSNALAVNGSIAVNGPWIRTENGQITFGYLTTTYDANIGGALNTSGAHAYYGGSLKTNYHSGGVKFFREQWIGNNYYTIHYDGVSAYLSTVHRHPAQWQPDGSTTNFLIDVPGIQITGLTNAANDAAAAGAGVAVGFLYRNGSALMIRVS